MLPPSLNAAGAQIEGAGTPVLRIGGAGGLLPGGACRTPLPDRIAAATYAAAAACAGGCVTRSKAARRCCWSPSSTFLSAAGCTVTAGAGDFTVARDPAAPLRGGAALCTGAWPGFATDTRPAGRRRAAGGAGARAPCTIRCLKTASPAPRGLRRWGRGRRRAGRDLVIPGGAALHGAAVTAPDLRGGAALVTAALGAAGRTLVADPGHIRRGYADLPGDLAALGARCRYLAPQEAEKIVEVP